MQVFIDTELWSFAQKIPEPSKFPDKSKYQRTLEIHDLAEKFLENQIKSNKILMTYHQINEIFHVLGFRGTKMSLKLTMEFCNQLLSSKFMMWRDFSLDHLKNAIVLSSKSSIHIWDYLCVLPIYRDIDIIYSCDEHFKHASFQSLGPPVENPIGVWMTL